MLGTTPASSPFVPRLARGRASRSVSTRAAKRTRRFYYLSRELEFKWASKNMALMPQLQKWASQFGPITRASVCPIHNSKRSADAAGLCKCT
jgi:hypothetical protein